MAIPDDVKDAAREAADPIRGVVTGGRGVVTGGRGVVTGGRDVDISNAERRNAYENQPEHVRGIEHGRGVVSMALPADLEAALRELSGEELALLQVCILGELRSGKSGFMAADVGDGAASTSQEDSP